MATPREKVSTVDPIWTALRQQAESMAGREPTLAGFVHATILQHDRLEQALSYHLARKLGGEDLSPLAIREMFDDAIDADLGAAVRADLSAVFERDPACHSYVDAFLFYKGFHALESYRISHWLWSEGREAMALFLQSRISQLFAVDIHPAARIGRGIMLDHATGIVIGETGGGRRCLHHAGRHPGRHRQGKRRPPSQDPPWRTVVAGRQDPGQYRGRRI